ncbi:MAG: hypothetical protein AAB608_00440 [Patescibacteria group bacterium]
MDEELYARLARNEEQRLNTLSDTGGFWGLIVLVLLLLAAAVFMFRAGDPVDPTITAQPSPTQAEVRQPRMYTVSYRGGVFSPTNLRIHIGDTVRMRNDGIAPLRIVSDPHPAHTGLPGLDSVSDIPQGSYFAFTFTKAGIFGYHNERDSSETGAIMVR